MKSYVVACLISLVLSVLVTPLVRRFALRIGAVSTPGGRHVNGRAIPRLGGIGLAFAWAVPVVALALRDPLVMRALDRQMAADRDRGRRRYRHLRGRRAG